MSIRTTDHHATVTVAKARAEQLARVGDSFAFLPASEVFPDVESVVLRPSARSSVTAFAGVPSAPGLVSAAEGSSPTAEGREVPRVCSRFSAARSVSTISFTLTDVAERASETFSRNFD